MTLCASFAEIKVKREDETEAEKPFSRLAWRHSIGVGEGGEKTVKELLKGRKLVD